MKIDAPREWWENRIKDEGDSEIGAGNPKWWHSPPWWHCTEPIPEQKCLHMSCDQCHGSGRKSDGTTCIHMISCPCPRCSPIYHTNKSPSQNL
jgi:hypothetical protein